MGSVGFTSSVGFNGRLPRRCRDGIYFSFTKMAAIVQEEERKFREAPTPPPVEKVMFEVKVQVRKIKVDQENKSVSAVDTLMEEGKSVNEADSEDFHTVKKIVVMDGGNADGAKKSGNEVMKDALQACRTLKDKFCTNHRELVSSTASFDINRDKFKAAGDQLQKSLDIVHSMGKDVKRQQNQLLKKADVIDKVGDDLHEATTRFTAIFARWREMLPENERPPNDAIAYLKKMTPSDPDYDDAAIDDLVKKATEHMKDEECVAAEKKNETCHCTVCCQCVSCFGKRKLVIAFQDAVAKKLKTMKDKEEESKEMKELKANDEKMKALPDGPSKSVVEPCPTLPPSNQR